MSLGSDASAALIRTPWNACSVFLGNFVFLRFALVGFDFEKELSLGDRGGLRGERVCGPGPCSRSVPEGISDIEDICLGSKVYIYIYIYIYQFSLSAVGDNNS